MKDLNKEFDKKFLDSYGTWKANWVYRDGGKIHIAGIKSFIRKREKESFREGQHDAMEYGDCKHSTRTRKQLLKEVRENLYKLRPKTIDPDALPDSDSKPEEAYELGRQDGIYLFEGNILKKLKELEDK